MLNSVEKCKRQDLRDYRWIILGKQNKDLEFSLWNSQTDFTKMNVIFRYILVFVNMNIMNVYHFRVLS